MALLLGCGLAPGARALELVPSVDFRQGYESNPLGKPSGREIDDFVTRINPSLRLLARTQLWKVSLDLRAKAKLYTDLTDLNTVDPVLRYKVSRELTHRLSLFSDGLYEDLSASEPVEVSGAILQDGRPDITRLRFGGGLHYRLSPRGSLRLSYRLNEEDYEPTQATGRSRRDQRTDVFTLVHEYLQDPRSSLSTSLTYRLIGFDKIDAVDGGNARDEQDDTQLALTTSWTHALTPRLSVTLTGGARVLETKGSGFSAPIFFPATGGTTDLALDESSTAFTGGFRLQRTGRRSSAQLGFNQETRPSSGRSGSIDTQTWTAGYTHRLSRRLSLNLAATMSSQGSAGTNFAVVDPNPADGSCPANTEFRTIAGLPPKCAVEVPSAIDQDLTAFSARLNWRVNKRFTTFLDYSYNDVDSTGVTSSSFDSHRVVIGLSYRYDIELL